MPSESTTSMRNALVAEIVGIADICNGEVPEGEDTFWRELTIWANKQPSDMAAANARMVIEFLGETWTDDYIEADGLTPTFGALEAAHDGITRRHLNGAATASTESIEPDEDEDVGLAAKGSLNVQATAWNLMTVVDQIRSGRLVLNPEWQRSFVWKPRKQQALIESMLYGLPIPSFLLYKDKTGKLFVIDGRQRLETISRFMGPVEAKGERRLRFKTFSSKQDGWRTGEYLHPAANKYYQDLPEVLRLNFDLTTLQMAVLDVDLDQLYQIFKRYNTGSVALNAAEIRNAVYQSTELHELMFRLGGEHRNASRYLDAEEKRVSEDFRDLMRNKSQRYGAYDFIGRFFAFAHETTGSVAKAINSFMHRHAEASQEQLERFRRQFLDAFVATTRWYQYPLIEPRDGGQFHAWIATIQMVASDHCLKKIASGNVSEEQIGAFIADNWTSFVEDQVLVEKQNSTNFWKYQRAWTDLIDAHFGAPDQVLSGA